MIVHQAIAVDPEGIVCLLVEECYKKMLEIVIVIEYILAIDPPEDYMINAAFTLFPCYSWQISPHPFLVNYTINKK